MTFPYTTPILGFVSEQDRACAEMLAVVGGPNQLVWTYLKENPAGNKWRPLVFPALFTPLKHFFCAAWFTPSGKLAITRYSIFTRAKYVSGVTRPWQGSDNESMTVHPDVVRHVHEILAAEAEARAQERREKSAARASA